MPPKKKKLDLPLRYILGSLIPITIITWYFYDKIGEEQSILKIILILVALFFQTGYLIISSKSRKKQKHMLWPIYGFLTGNGQLPMRLFVISMTLIALVAVGFEISGLKSVNPLPSSFIGRFVEIDLYWTVLNFLGNSDNSLEAVGFSKFLTILSTFLGLLFWGIFISVLVNKSQELADSSKQLASPEKISPAFIDVISNKPYTHNRISLPKEIAEEQKLKTNLNNLKVSSQ